MVIYGGVGIGVTAYDTMVNALDANGQPYILYSIAFHYRSNTLKPKEHPEYIEKCDG